jgi:triacylglycerol lipase
MGDRPPSPVILVHGIGDTPDVFGPMAAVLRARGHEPHAVAMTPASGRVGLDRLALQLQAYIDVRIGSEQVGLVGFSMGGLVARYYVQRLGGISRVRRFLTLSTPHRGSWWARLLANEGGVQMRPGSEFLADLDRDAEVLEQVGFVSLWTPCDLMILPARSSVIASGEQIRLPVLLHPWMLTDRRCLERVAGLLEVQPQA